MVWKTSRVTTSKMIDRRSGASVRPAGQPDRTRRTGRLLAPAGAGGRGPGGPPDVAGAQEDQAGDTGRGRDQDGDLAHRVPGPDVDEGHVDDVAAAAERHRLLGERPPRPVCACGHRWSTSMTPATSAATTAPSAIRQ